MDAAAHDLLDHALAADAGQPDRRPFRPGRRLQPLVSRRPAGVFHGCQRSVYAIRTAAGPANAGADTQTFRIRMRARHPFPPPSTRESGAHSFGGRRHYSSIRLSRRPHLHELAVGPE